MKTLVLLLMLCICPIVACAQNAPVIERAAALRKAEKFDDARKLLQTELDETQTQAERDKLNNALADVHFAWAGNLTKSYDFQGAIAHYLAAYQTDKMLRRRDAAIDLARVGARNYSLGRYEEALRYYDLALPIFREVKEPLGEASTLNNVAVAYDDLSRYEDALRAYQQALVLVRELKSRAGEAATLSNIGSVYYSLNRYDEALRTFEQALPIRREVGDRDGEAATLNNIGLACDGLSRYEEALTFYQQALPIRREIGDRRGEAVTLDNIGAAYHSLKRYDEALDFYRQALPIRRAAKDRAGEAATLNNIGLIYGDLGRADEALRTFEQALLPARAIKNRAGEAATLYNMMFVCRQRHQPELAILFGKQAVNVLQSIRRDIAGLDRESRDAYLKGNANIYQTLARLLIGQGRFAEAEEVSAMLQQDEFLDFVRRDARGVRLEDASADFVGAEQTVVAEQNTRVESVAKLSAEAFALTDLDAPTPAQSARLLEVQASLNAARAQLDAFFAAMPTRFARNAADVAADRKGLSAIVPILREMGAKSKSKVALVSAFVDDKGLELLLTLPSGQTVNLSYAADEKAQNGAAFPSWLNAQIFDFKRAIEQRAPVEGAATALWNVVGCKGTLSAQLEGAQIDTVMWRLTGPLRAIPLAALRDRDGYLVEKYRNVILTAGSSELNLAHQPVGNWRALGVGVTKAWTIGDDQFSALSGVEGELKAVMDAPADGFPNGVLPGRVLQDEKFSAASFFRQLRGADAEANSPWQVVHIASHFKLAGDNLKSFLLTGDGKALTIADLQERAQTSPLFPGVELMTLSACDTASGGQGADSLGALAELNGARSVLATLWPVADQETAQLMADFYANHAATPTAGKAVALQNAQLKLLHAGGISAHPYYWAPFVLMGNWR